jgi:hypothetical protein
MVCDEKRSTGLVVGDLTQLSDDCPYGSGRNTPLDLDDVIGMASPFSGAQPCISPSASFGRGGVYFDCQPLFSKGMSGSVKNGGFE